MNKLKIIGINVRGINSMSRAYAVKDLFKRENPDILLLSETKMHINSDERIIKILASLGLVRLSISSIPARGVGFILNKHSFTDFKVVQLDEDCLIINLSTQNMKINVIYLNLRKNPTEILKVHNKINKAIFFHAGSVILLGDFNMGYGEFDAKYLSY